MSDSEHSDASVTWEDFFGTSTDLVPTLLGMYDAALRETTSGSQTSKQHKRRSIISLQQTSTSSRPTSPSLLKQCLTTNVSKTEKRQSSTTLPGDTATSCIAGNSNGANLITKNCGSSLHGNIKKQLNIASRTQSTCSINSYVFTPNVKRILSNLEDDVTVSSPCLSPTSSESKNVDYCNSSKDTTCFMSCVKKCECSRSSEDSCSKSHEHRCTNTCEDSDKCKNYLKKVDLLQSESTNIFTGEIPSDIKVSDQKSKNEYSQSGLNDSLQNKSSSQNKNDQNSKSKSPLNDRPLTFTDGLRNCFLYRYNSTLRNKLTSPILSRKVPKTNTVDNNSRVPINIVNRENTNNDSNVTASEDIPTAKDNKSTVSFQQSKIRNAPIIPKIELESKSSPSPESSANDDLDGGTTSTGRGSSLLLQVPRPLSMSSIASSTSTSSASSGGVANKSGVNAYLASIESLDDDSDCDNDLRHVNRTLARVKECEKENGSQGSGDSGIMVSVPICVYPRPARYCDPQLSPVERVLMEIVDTEAVYVDDLHQVIQGYLDHWKQDKECLLLEHLPDLFSNIEEIYSFNSKFLDQLQQCGLDAVNISRTFVQNNDGFEIYTQYCTNYPKTMSVLTRLMSSDMTAKMFRDLQSKLGHSLPLGSYLLKPVQRILKYHLLLQNLMKQCGSEDVSDIELALLTMTGIAQHINNMKRKHEHEVRVQEIQSLLYGWDGEDLTTFGELCAEGTFRMHGAKAQRHAFLFDKMLLLTKNKEDGILSYKAHIMCSNLMLIESVPGEPLSFHVIPFDNPRMQCTLQARNLEQKREWTLQLKRVILENYNAVIPSHARQLVMQLGQNRTDDEVLAEKSNSGKKQHSAPEYLQRRKIDRERRKSETGLRYKLRKSRKSDVSPSIDAIDADELHDGEETSSPSSVTRRSLTRNCSENRERSKSRDTFVKFGSWRRKSEPGAEVNYFSSNEQNNNSKSSTLERFLSPERQSDFKISQYNTKTIPKKITKLKKARNKHRSAKFYTDLDISSACDEVLHISESNDSLEAVENQEIEEKVVAVSECTDNDAKDCNSNKDTDTENNTETIENIVSQLLMQNREFQKILKKQKKHINLRNRLNKTPTFESNKNKEIDNASDVEINIENSNIEEGENIYETLLNNADNGKFTDLTKEQNAKFDESDYVTLILDNTHKDKNEILSLENMNRNNKIQERVLQNKLNDSKKSPVKLNLKDDPSLPNSEKAVKKLDEKNTSVETQESSVNYENLNDLRKKFDLSSSDPEAMSDGVCPNTAEIWLKQQNEHMATPSTKKAGSLPRSFELNEYFPFEKCLKYLSRDGKPLNSDRPLTVASDNLADIDFSDITNFFLEMSNEHSSDICSKTKGENTVEVQVEIEDTKEEPIYDVPISKPVLDEKSDLPSINFHPEYKIYRPSINLSAVKNVLAKANKKPLKFDETNSIEDLTKERKQTATIVRHYSRSLLQRFKSIINEDIQNSSEFSESVNELNQTNEKNLSDSQKENDVNQIYDVPRKIVIDRSSDVKEEGILYGCVSSSNPKINDPCYNLNTAILNSESSWPAIRVSPCKDLPTYKQGSESLGARIAQSDYANPRELFVNVKPENILINTYSLRPDSLLSNSSHFTSSSDEYQDEEHDKTKTDRNSNSDCYYETTAERLLENDVFRDSAVYSDHDDGVANKDKTLTEAINPTAKIVRHESISKLKSQRNHILVEKTPSRIVRNTQIHETVEQSRATISDVKNGNSLKKTCSNPLNKRQIKRPTKLPPPIPVKPELKLCKTETVHLSKVETVNDTNKRTETEHSNVQLTRNEQTSFKKESVRVEINKSIVQRRMELEEISNTSKSSKVSVMKKPVGDVASRNFDRKVMEIEKSTVIKKDSRIPMGKYSIDKKRVDFDEKCLKRQMFNSDINENKTESSSEETVAKEMLSSPHSKGWVKHVVEKFQ